MTQTIFWKHTVILTFGVFCMSALAGPMATPAQTAKQFCSFYMERNLDQQYRQVVSSSFNKAIGDAERKDRTLSERNPDGKPPLGDGLPFQSISDKGSCTVGAAKKINGRMQATISYDIGDGTSIRDQLVMLQENNEWKIDDILFGPRHTDSMRRKLKQIFSMYKL